MEDEKGPREKKGELRRMEERRPQVPPLDLRGLSMKKVVHKEVPPVTVEEGHIF